MEWKITHEYVPYPEALATMAARVAAIQAGKAEELVWLVEHPPLYTLGTSAKAGDVLSPAIPSFETGRGGQVTYHGPGQRVVYLMLDLKRRAAARGGEPDLRAYVADLERWVIETLAMFGIEGVTRQGRVGVWVEECQAGAPAREKKIAALGVRVQKWVTSHGIALNVHPDLSHYAGIVPCGIREYGVTSMRALGCSATLAEVDEALRSRFFKVLGSTVAKHQAPGT